MPVSETRAVTATRAFEMRLRKRKRSEARFRLYGQCAIAFAAVVLAILLFSVGKEARNAFTHYRASVEFVPDSVETRDVYLNIRDKLLEQFPESQSDRITTREIGRLVTTLAALPIAKRLEAKPGQLGNPIIASVPVSDVADLYLKGQMTPREHFRVRLADRNELNVSGDMSDLYQRFRLGLQTEAKSFRARVLAPAELALRHDKARLQKKPDDTGLQRRVVDATARLQTAQSTYDALFARADQTSFIPGLTDLSLLITLPEGSFEVTALSADQMTIEPLLAWHAPERLHGDVLVLDSRAGRPISNLQIAAITALDEMGIVEPSWNWPLFLNADSSDPELAGVVAGLLGSLLIVLVTMALAVPVGIAAAIYLEEFAANTWLTRFIQVNINNLAAVPSIVFGLLGAAVFVNGIDIGLPFTDHVFRFGGGLGRGWPFVGGLVLALMTLPTIIISSRAALGAVPQSIRQAALAVGASRLQMVLHHVLPQAAPGVLTGSIIGLAQAIGETAPLLLIGMVAFVAEAPEGLNERSTALPVLIYQWSTRSERAWEPMTSAAIVLLLLVMLLMNATSIWLRLKFERSRV